MAQRSYWRIWGLALSLVIFVSWATPLAAQDAVRKFTVVNVLYEGSKMFLPSVLAVSQGDTVSVTVINNIPGDPPNHGFAIPAFEVETVVNHGEKKTVEFTADKAGIFDIRCQLHPAHVHGQLIVED
ncbi:MAG: cupredoxin domain-containing protein [Desulfurellaceae bacterium]|nr:cupredoxin domain-containing protein [Desulfurellaceae bacterium]